MKPLSELKAIAEAANDPWGKGLNVALVMNTFNDTFGPSTVKALIERIEELEEQTVPDDLTSYIQERVKAERERCAVLASSFRHETGPLLSTAAYGRAAKLQADIINGKESAEADKILEGK